MIFSRCNKVSVVVTLCSLFAYVLYWLFETVATIYNLILNGITIPQLLSFYYLSDVLIPAVGIVLRFVGVSFALVAVYLIWGPKTLSFLSVKKKISVAILFEGMYFLLLLPITLYYLVQGNILTFFTGYLLEIISVFPLLVVLSVKIWRYDGSGNEKLLTWIFIAGIGYLVHIWISNVFRWLSMVEISGLNFLFQGIIVIGFLNTIVILSMSLIFAVVGCYYLSYTDDRRLGTKLLGIALVLLSLHFFIYILYSVVVGASSYSVMSVEIWPVAILGLGLVMLFGANKT